MINIRAKFVRNEEVKYISHLDLMMVFERALRRSNINIVYSQGFNPHPQMVFGLPLSVGVTSDSEYADFEIINSITPEEFVIELNKELPKGLTIISAKEKKVKDNIMASIAAAKYEVIIAMDSDTCKEDLKKKIDEFLNMSSIKVKKFSKRGNREIDIKPMIKSIEIKDVEIYAKEDVHYENNYLSHNVLRYIRDLRENEFYGLSYNPENVLCFSAFLSAGSVANLKPELLMQAINESLGMNLKTVKIHRTGLFVGNVDNLKDPIDEAVLTGA